MKNFKLKNSSNLGSDIDSTLETTSESLTFENGAGIPYFNGVKESYQYLPEVKQLNDLFYSPKGLTIDNWVHLPGVGIDDYNFSFTFNPQKFYRLMLSNENFGNKEVNGLLYGFTRDRQITQDKEKSPHILDNPVSDTCFFITKTKSVSNNEIRFENRVSEGDCDGVNGCYALKVPVNSQGLSSVVNELVHIVTTFSPLTDEIKVYCDGNLVTVSSYFDVFGIENPINNSINVPSFVDSGSHTYTTSGPKVGRYFTPWVIGGGYTDGAPSGFLGDGNESGLEGYMGSTKFYNCPLTQDEVLENFNANKEFFKNLVIEQKQAELHPIEVYEGASSLQSSSYFVEVYNGITWVSAFLFAESDIGLAAQGGPSAPRVNKFWASGTSGVTMHYLTFGSDRRTLVRIGSTVSSVEDSIIRPFLKNKAYIQSDNSIVIEISPGDTFWIIPNPSDTKNHVFISCELPKPPIPTENVLYYGPGIHDVGYNFSSIQSNTTVYIDGGAYVAGTFNIKGKNNIKFIGRGMIRKPFGATRELYLSARAASSNIVSSNFPNGWVAIDHGYNLSSTGLEIDGITFINCILWHCLGINKVTNVKVISPWNYSTDGPQVIPDAITRKGSFTNSFVLNADDCITAAGLDPLHTLSSTTPSEVVYSSLVLYTVANGPISFCYNPRIYGESKRLTVSAYNITAANFSVSNSSVISTNSLVKLLLDNYSVQNTSAVSANPSIQGFFNLDFFNVYFEENNFMRFLSMGNIKDPYNTTNIGADVSSGVFGNISGISFRNIEASGYGPYFTSSPILGLNNDNRVFDIDFINIKLNNVFVDKNNFRTYFRFNEFSDPDLIDSRIRFLRE